MASRVPERRPRLVQSVDRALRIAEILVDEPGGLPLSALAARMKLAPQTAQGLVRTLQHHGLVAQTGPGMPYTTGPAVAALARRWSVRQPRAGLARDAVLALSRRIGEYVLLAELRGDVIFALVEARSSQELAVAYEHCSGERLHRMATGKVLLAGLPPEERERLSRGLDFSRHGPRSITGRRELERELSKVRRRGYAVCREEGARGVAALGVPLLDADGRVVAALGASLPTSRFSPTRRRNILAELRRCASSLTKAWGLAGR